MSYHLDGNYSADEHHTMSSYAARRSSMYSQYSRYGPQPPLPHQAQPHFYGAPDANLLLSPLIPGLIPGDNGYFCGFDSLCGSSRESSKAVENVIVAGYDGGLDVHSVSKRGLNKILRLDGLRGGVYNAKILPPNFRNDSIQHLPLIAIVVHGAVWQSNDSSNSENAIPSEGVSTSQPGSVRGSPRIPRPPNHENDPSNEYYQTTVEVYSMTTKQHVTTLLSLPKQHLGIPSSSPLFRTPAPMGSLTIRADNGYLVITSGATGETWIFHQKRAVLASSETFKCIGKVWTSVQHGFTVDPTSLQGLVDGDWHNTDPSPSRQQYKASILSLNGRWLAYCPSAPSSQVSIRATVSLGTPTPRVPGLNGQAPPQLPAVNCLVETPGGESMMKQLAQAATQEVLKGAAYIGKQGVQAWNNYWKGPSLNQTANSSVQYAPHQSIAHQFPPTHAGSSQVPAVNKDPGLISILDLDFLAEHPFSGTSPHPLATFKVPHGCSFLSFAPSGLALFTASSKGDMQFVWDLMRVQYAKSSFLKGGTQGNTIHGPHVRQIAHFSRMTIARIVDVVWTSPHGERAAMVTEPGTVHILDLPASAFTWPPPRRKIPSYKNDEDGVVGTLSAAGVASTAVNSLWTAARPLVGRRRRSSTGVSSISAASVTSQAGHGTQALAAGISRSVGAATGRMNEMRKSGGPKLHLPRNAVIPSRACIRLLNGKRNDSVLVVGGGIVGLYTVKSRRGDRPADKQKASRGAKYVEHRMPSLPDFKLAPEIALDIHQVADLDFTERDLESPRSKIKQTQMPASRPRVAESSIPQAEIESNAPYQPFHTDRRVGLQVYTLEEAESRSPSVSALFSSIPPKVETTSKLESNSKIPWAFGGAINSVKLDVGPPQNTEDSFYAPSDHRALPSSAIERVMKVTDHSDDIEQIVVTTRIRKGSRFGTDSTTGGDEEGFFEDDCEVLDFASQRV